jgi:hypothetical protein
MKLLDLSAELLLFIAEILESEEDLNAFTQTKNQCQQAGELAAQGRPPQPPNP